MNKLLKEFNKDLKFDSAIKKRIKDREKALARYNEKFSKLTLDEAKEFVSQIKGVKSILNSSRTQLNFKILPVFSPNEILNDVYGSTESKKIDPFEIAEFYGLKLQEVDQENSYTLASIYYDGKNIIIEYISHENKAINEALVAHELGHLFSHLLHGHIEISEDWDPSIKKRFSNMDNNNQRDWMLKAACMADNQDNEYEEEAWSYAADLLYPEQTLKNKTLEDASPIDDIKILLNMRNKAEKNG